MKWLRNLEISRVLLTYSLLSICFIVISFWFDLRFGLLAFVFCSLFISVYVFTTYRRYQRISQLATDVNHILHGYNEISLKEYTEGELGILQSEIYKMTVRLREQRLTLLDDKKYLADSIADISHQIRTPLTSINLLVSMLTDANITEQRRRQMIHELMELLSRIDWLITTLLKISKLDAGTVQLKREKVELKDLIDKSTSSLLVPMELREHSLEIKAEGSFIGDLSWTQEAITNIIKNCMEHTPNGGLIRILAAENAIYSEITISDNGKGIDKEDLPHIFERFYKGKNSDDRSYGIGLALARMIITNQNGTIKAENIVGSGALFTIRFYKGTV